MHELYDARVASGLGGRLYGVYPATVVDNQDPDKQGRVQIRLDWATDPGGERFEAWARLATMMAGNNRGSFFIPDKGDEVLVSFAAGDPRYPFVVGALWNGVDAPPESIDADNTKKVLRSRNGVRVELNDQDGQESFTVTTPGGRTLTLKDQSTSIEIDAGQGNIIKLEPSAVSIQAAAKVTISAGQVEVSAGMVTVDAGMAKFSGVVQCSTLIATSVVGTSYTPGAGNLL